MGVFEEEMIDRGMDEVGDFDPMDERGCPVSDLFGISSLYRSLLWAVNVKFITQASDCVKTFPQLLRLDNRRYGRNGRDRQTYKLQGRSPETDLSFV